MSTVLTTMRPVERQEEIDLGEIGANIRRNWQRIVILTVATTWIALLIALFMAPRFSIGGSLYLGDARPTPPSGDTGPLDYLSDFQSVSDINTQIELISGDAMVEQAILESGLNATVTPDGRHSMRYWRWRLLHGQAVEAFAPAPGDLAALDARFASPPTGPVTFDIIIGSHHTYSIDCRCGWFGATSPVLTGVLGQPASGGGLSLLLTPAVAGVAPVPGRRFVMRVTPAAALAEHLRVDRLLTVVAGGTLANPTKVANVQLLSTDPYRGQMFVNRLMTDFIASQIAWKTQSASASEDFIAGQLAQVKAALADADRKLAAYQSQTGIIDVPENAKSAIGEVSQYQTQRAALALQQQALQQLNDEIAHPSGGVNPYLITQSNDPTLSSLAGTLASEEEKLQALQVQFTSGSPDVQVQQATVDRIEQSIRSVVANDLAQATSSLADMDAQIATLNAQFKDMPKQSLEVVGLTRASEVYGQIYVLLMQKQAEAEVSKAVNTADTRTVAAAEIPLRASAPDVPLMVAVGVFAGLFGGVALILAQHALSGRFQSEAEIRRAVQMPVYGMIPLQSSLAAAEVFPTSRQTPFAEAFRLLRSAIYRSASELTSRVVLITSASQNDGKTSIALNLAKSMADDGKRVVLVDADLHVGRLHEITQVDPLNGLTEWLVSMKQPHLMRAHCQRFSVLPAGVLPPNPSELLNEPYFAEIVTALRAEFDYIIIDSPPLPATSDALALGAHADLVLSVVRIEHTLKRVLEVHNEMMATIDRRHGVVINGVPGNKYGYGYQIKPATKLQRMLRPVKRILGV